jgi:hypothetical protein
LYGHIEAAKLFYNDLSHTIQEKLGFQQNQYDPCVCNKTVEDKKITIRIHVDDWKVSSQSKELLEEVIVKLHETYGEITVHSGDEHNYLGMVLSYHPELKTITMSMRK